MYASLAWVVVLKKLYSKKTIIRLLSTTFCWKTLGTIVPIKATLSYSPNLNVIED